MEHIKTLYNLSGEKYDGSNVSKKKLGQGHVYCCEGSPLWLTSVWKPLGAAESSCWRFLWERSPLCCLIVLAVQQPCVLFNWFYYWVYRIICSKTCIHFDGVLFQMCKLPVPKALIHLHTIREVGFWILCWSQAILSYSSLEKITVVSKNNFEPMQWSPELNQTCSCRLSLILTFSFDVWAQRVLQIFLIKMTSSCSLTRI